MSDDTKTPAASVSATAGRDALRRMGKAALDAYEAIPYDNNLSNGDIHEAMGRAALDGLPEGQQRADGPLDDECLSCGEGDPLNECPKSRRPCGHHCNHVWTHDGCDWCGYESEADALAALDGLPDTPTDEGPYHCDICGSDTHDTIVHDPLPRGPAPAARPETDEPLRRDVERLCETGGNATGCIRIADLRAALAAAPDRAGLDPAMVARAATRLREIERQAVAGIHDDNTHWAAEQVLRAALDEGESA